MAFDEGVDVGAVEEEGFVGFEGEDGDAGVGAGLDGLRADAGDVETHVVIFFGDFDGDGAAGLASECAAAGEARVGAFEALDGEDDSIFDDNELADLKARNFLGDAVREGDVFLLLTGEFGAEMKSLPGHEGF